MNISRLWQGAFSKWPFSPLDVFFLEFIVVVLVLVLFTLLSKLLAIYIIIVATSTPYFADLSHNCIITIASKACTHCSAQCPTFRTFITCCNLT